MTIQWYVQTKRLARRANSTRALLFSNLFNGQTCAQAVVFQSLLTTIKSQTMTKNIHKVDFDIEA